MLVKILKKYITIFAIMIILVLTVKADVCAEAVWNTTGETTSTGFVYMYKYWNGTSWSHSSMGTIKDPSEFIDITYEVTYCYEEAYKMNEYVNEQRRLAGVPEVEMKDEIMDVAMQRAAESAIYWEHIRPSGISIETVSMFVDGENLHKGSEFAKDANEDLANSPGHYATMIDSMWRYAGYGCVKVGSGHYWVQVFTYPEKYYEDGYDSQWHYENDYYVNGVKVVVPSPNDKPVVWDELVTGMRKNRTTYFTTKIKPKSLSLQSHDFAPDKSIFEEDYYVGESFIPKVRTYYVDDRPQNGNHPGQIDLPSIQYDVTVLTPDICSYSRGLAGESVTCLKPGTARIQFTLKADRSISTVLEVTIKDKPVEKGDMYQNGMDAYKVTSTSKKTVSYVSTDSSEEKVTIPATIKIQGENYKVTTVAKNAFKNNKSITSVIIGKNVTKIEKNAFYGCKKLKKLTVKSTKIKSVGKNAFKGIHKKATIKVPKSKLSKYKKLFKNKGQKKTVKIMK